MMALAILVAFTALPGFADGCPVEAIETDQRFDGIYVDDFEGQRFFERARNVADLDFRKRPMIWFAPDVVAIGSLHGVAKRIPGHAYRMVFRGVKRSYNGLKVKPYTLCGYGHMNAFSARIDLISLESIQPLGAAR